MCVARVGIFNGTAGLLIDAARPIHRSKFLRGQKHSGVPIDDVEESVFWRVQQDVAGLSLDRQGRQGNLLTRGEVPRLARRFLVVPQVFP